MKKTLTLLLLYIASYSVEAQCWQTVSAGIDHTIAIRPDGTLWAWGFNGSGQLGDGTLENRGIPVQIGTGTDWKTVSASGNQSFAIKNDGTLWAWGENLWGQLGIGTFGTKKNVPTKIGSANDWKSISAGLTFSLAIKNNGTLWAWGDNSSGQLGNQSVTAYTPVQVGSAIDWQVVVAGGLHTLAIKTDGTLWGWGYNLWGQLGDGTTIDRSTPTKIGTAMDWKYIAVGYAHSLGVKTDGTLWSWGDNHLGQLGDDSFVDKNIPTRIGSETNWQSVSSGMQSSLAIRTDGTIWAWGQIIGKFSYGTNNTRKTPTQLGTDTNWKWNTSGETHSFGLRTDGALWGWGNNNWGKLGDNTFLDNPEPRIISTPTPLGATIQAFCNAATVADLEATGTAIKWYASSSGGIPLTPNQGLVNGNHYYATQTIGSCESAYRLDVNVVVNLTLTPAPTGEAAQTFCVSTTIADLRAIGKDIKWYSAPTGGTALASDLALVSGTTYYASQTLNYCESPARLAVTFTLKRTSAPTDIPSPYIICEGAIIGSVSSSNINWYSAPTGGTKLPIETKIINGTKYYASRVGECGESASRAEILIILKTTPPPISLFNETWKSIVAGDGYSAAVRSDGTLWLWGSEYLGSSYATDLYSPWQSGPDNTWLSVSRGGDKRMGIQTNGEIYELYSGQSISRKFGNEKDWRAITTYGYGTNYHVLAIKVDGTLWAWGSNNAGQLGDGTVIDKTSPTKIGEAKDWKSVSNGYQFTLAIKTDGTLWAWGNNEYGQLGDGTKLEKKVPIRIGTDSDWQFISTSKASSMGIKRDGTLWVWGDNAYGKLGDGTTQEKKVPTKIDNSSWLTVSIGDWHTLGVKTDGTLWAWGRGDFGSLGIGYTAPIWQSDGYISTPKQVGEATNWMSVIAGGHSMALTKEGVLWVWGPNERGELGIGRVLSKQYEPLTLPAKQFSCGKDIKLADLPVQGTNIKWYTNYRENLDLNVPDSFIISSGQHFYATQTINGIESCKRLDVVGDKHFPLTPQGSQDQIFCKGASVAQLVPSGAGIRWYEAASGSTPLPITTALTDGKRYYASQSFKGCESTERFSVVATLTEPLPPSGSSLQAFCNGASIAHLVPSGSAIKWYETESGGSPLPITATLLDGKLYYASQSLKGCESTERLRVVVTIIAPSSPSGSSMQAFCKGASVAQLVPSGPDINWYETEKGGLPLQGKVRLIDGKKYYASQTFGNCESSIRFSVVTAVTNTLPPTGESFQAFELGKTISDLIVSGSNIKWYGSLENALSRTNTLLVTEPLIDNKIYFATQTISDCESVSALAVQASIIAGTQSEEKGLTLYPNPVDNVLNISHTQIMDKVIIVNMLGQKVLSKKVNGRRADLDFSKLDNGIYLVQILFNKKLLSYTVIKK